MSRRCVVCVDDERMVLAALRDQLRGRFGRDLRIEIAESGEEGLEILAELTAEGVEVPVVISDQLMPGMKGEEFLRRVHEVDPSILTILLTGQATAEAVGAAVNAARLYRFVAKPWSQQDLEMTVREALRAYALAAELGLREAELESTHSASLRFVPREFLGLLGRQRVVDARLGEHVERTVHLWCLDIRGYTTLVERLHHQRAFALVGEFLARMEGCVRRGGGFVNNIEGDAILALFPGSASEALGAAVAAGRALATFNEEQLRAGAPTLEIGLGVHTGPLLLGIIGSDERLQCDLLGDAVSEAVRLEGLTKVLGVRALVSRATYEQLRPDERARLREIDELRVAASGVTAPVYEVLDARSEVPT